ncbi:hypothetical protein HH1059_00510 [Halorhodospira halochloris]|uniref:Uncharacterized protein n=1 Tax=Halorhodospira halochloris TaxID=1052 RepID=A0A0X8X6Y5_HALHR|nr:hypothetical protein [Halorhodospira halochloris]MBK1650784.1 hypothetical protein [Halorhodospira halochloris]MCG5548849.1 hypothetical protein [Halorhodospira halochloris]BAU56720.2 hypothetical protein HH1059_00510 [Halorhodospira halochloris]
MALHLFARLYSTAVLGMGVILASPQQLLAADNEYPWDVPFGNMTHVPATELANWRGGWTDPNGVVVRFGFHHSVALDGEAMSSIQLDMVSLPLNSDLRHIANDVANAFRLTTSDGVEMRIGDRGVEMILQNSLDGRLIQVLQDLDVHLEGVPMMRFNKQLEMLQNQVIEGLH